MKTYEQLYDEKGNYRLDESYTEILKLHKLLIDANIPHTFDRFLDGWQIVYPNNENRVADASQHFGSYGNEKNLLEIMGLLTPIEEESDSVLGRLTAEDVFNRIREHYTAHNHERKTNYGRIKECLEKGGNGRVKYRNIVVRVLKYATESLDKTLTKYGEDGFKLVNVVMAKDEDSYTVMHLFFTKEEREVTEE